jgi:hypothetical protein
VDCERCRELLSARLDGPLSAGEDSALREHLARCPACREAESQLAVIHNMMAGLEEVPAPEGFAQSVMARVRKEQPSRVIPLFRRPQLRALAGLAACLVLAAGLYNISLGQKERALRSGFQQDAGISLTSAGPEEAGDSAQDSSALPFCFTAQGNEDGIAGPPARQASSEQTDPRPETKAVNSPELLADRAVLVLERMPDGAEDLIPPETEVTCSTNTGEEGYRWLDTGSEPEVLAQIEQLALEQDIPLFRPAQPEEALYHLVILLPQT